MMRLRFQMKRFTAMLLTTCLLMPLGTVNTWAEKADYSAAAETAAVQTETAAVQTETASASNAEAAAETTQKVPASAATDSDAQFDEDGFLLDGEVSDDVTEEMDPEAEFELIAPEMKTDVIGKQDAVSEWLADYEYDLNSDLRIVTLNKYTGTAPDVIVPATATVNGSTYSAAVRDPDYLKGSVWAGTTVRSITLEDGLKLPLDMSYLFASCQNLEQVNTPDLDTSKATSMKSMFSSCERLTHLNLSSFITSNVKDMSFMFASCYDLTSLGLDNFTTGQVTNMNSMFASCYKLDHISFGDGFDTSKVKDMNYMFGNCKKLTSLDLSGFDMRAVTKGRYMFHACSSLERLNIPIDCRIDVELPCEMQKQRGGELLTHLPKNEMHSYPIVSADKYVFVTSIVLNTTARTLTKGETFQLKGWPQPVNATNRNVKWYSLNDTVAAVSNEGLVTARNEGTATIVCESMDGDVFAQCEITVGVPVSGIKINTTARNMEVGKTFQLAAWPQPSNASNRTVLWSSSDKNVATVNAAGLVTAKAGGVAIITAKSQDRGYTATCAVTVNLHVTSVKINTTAKTIEAGKSFQLAAWPQPANATNKAVAWFSSNTAVATVSSTGLVKGIKNGTANITVKTADGGKTATCRITVGIPVTGVKINTTSRTVEARKTFQMAAWPQPSNASNKAVTWTSSNTSVASVNSSGLVTGIKNGTTTITVKTVDGGYTKTCVMTVGIPVTSVNINTTAKVMNVGKTFQLAAWPQPANATNKIVIWSSSNTGVATVSGTGLITARKKGTSTITVKTQDGGYTATCKVTVE